MPDNAVSWQEVGSPGGDCHYFAATIDGRRFNVVKPSHCNKWHAYDVDLVNAKRDPKAGRIGREYDRQLHAFEACSRHAGNGNGFHGYARSRASLVEEANELTAKHGGPQCTFAACSNEELWRVITQLRAQG